MKHADRASGPPQPLSLFHIPALVLCLNATGYAYILLGRGGDAHLPFFCSLVLTGLSWYGMGRMILLRRTPGYRAFGMLLAGVDAAWAAWLLRGEVPEGFPRAELLGLAVGLCGLGLLVALHSLLLRRPVPKGGLRGC